MFLRGVIAVLLFVIALFLLIGSFGQAVFCPKGMFDGAYSVVGRSAFLLPIVCVYWASLSLSMKNISYLS